MDPADIAATRFSEGFNYSQSILSAFSEQTYLPIEIAFRIAAPFGAGLGRLGRTCGAVTGALDSRELLGFDLSNPEALQLTGERNLFAEHCPQFVRVSAQLLAGLFETEERGSRENF